MYSTFVFDLKLISSYSIFIPIFFEIMQRFFQRFYPTLSCIKMKNCQTYFQNPVVWTPKDFQSIFGHFWKLCMKGLNIYLTNWFRWIFHFFILLAPSSKEFSNKYMSVLFQYVFMSRSINVLFLVYECVENPCYKNPYFKDINLHILKISWLVATEHLTGFMLTYEFVNTFSININLQLPEKNNKLHSYQVLNHIHVYLFSESLLRCSRGESW